MMAPGCLRDLGRFLSGSRWRVLFTVWLSIIVLVCLAWLVGANVNDRTVAVSTLVCGLSTSVYWCHREGIASRLSRWTARPRTKFILVGSLGAVWVEFVFWLLERAFGASGVAAHPNLVLDLVATMPWYVVMIALLWRVETTYRYSPSEILLLGGVYELGADGFIGSLLGGTLSLAAVPLLFALVPLFMVVYSFMVLPCSDLLRGEIDGIRRERDVRGGVGRRVYGLLPLLGLVPYLVLGVLASV